MRFFTAATLLAAITLALPTAVSAQGTEIRPINVRLTFHLIEADGEQRADPEILAVTTELRKLFRFDGYRLVTKSVLNATAWPHSNVRQRVSDDAGRLGYFQTAKTPPITACTISWYAANKAQAPTGGPENVV